MVVLHRPEGQQLAFYNSSSVWVPTWKTDDTLTKDATGWRYTQSDGVVEAYDETGRLTGIEKPNGNHITLSYLNGELSSITDGFGRTIQFQYQDGRMVSVTDPAGGSIQYQYNSAGKLAEVIYQTIRAAAISTMTRMHRVCSLGWWTRTATVSPHGDMILRGERF